MATTQESIVDGLRWLGSLAKIGMRRGVILGAFIALFALAVVVTTRDTVSDCGDVSDRQKALLTSLIEPEPERSFLATDRAECIEGELSAPVEVIATSMDETTDQLLAEGWVLESTYISYYRQRWRNCFRRDLPGWERVQVTVDATRGGTVTALTATAPEGVDACDHERREVSVIYPPG